MLRGSKCILMFLVMLLLIGLLAGCRTTTTQSGEAGSVPIGEEFDPSAVSEIPTVCGPLVVPQQYLPALKTDVQEKEEGCVVRFFTEQNGTKYDLFFVSIGPEGGDPVGELTDETGTARPVYVSVNDLGDLSALSQEQQDQLYALQEAVNTVIEHLH